MEIVKFIPEYAQVISDMVMENLYKVNIKDYKIEDMHDMAKKHTVQDILEYGATRHMLVALIDGEIVGTGTVYRSDEEETQFNVATYFILPSVQGKGIGKALFKDLEEYAVANGAKTLKVWASLSSPEFYKAMGFEFILKEKIAPDGQNYPMIKYL